jgi:hypothetical protein
MRKIVVLALSLVFGGVCASQAVVIHWSAGGVPVGTSSATLVYVSDGSLPVYANGVVANGVELGGMVEGLAITPTGIGEQSATDVVRSSGAYYVVLFDDSGNYAVSNEYLAYNDSAVAGHPDALYPWTGDGSPPDLGLSDFSGWAPVPEPSVAMLLAVGAAVAALRRKRRA